MNEAIAQNIRRERDNKCWTQSVLAQAAKVEVRTIQRAEEGRGVSAETLLAIAGALAVEIGLLRFDPTGALAEHLGIPGDVPPDVEFPWRW